MALEGPKPAWFWDISTNCWRPAVPGEPGDLVWNATNKSWEPGAIGGNWKWNATNKSWEPGPGGEYIWDATNKAWTPVTTAGYGGSHYWDATNKSWVPNTGRAVSYERITEDGTPRITEDSNIRVTEAA